SGVYSAATASIVPLRSESWTLAIKAAGTQEERQGSSRFNWISDEFFRTMGAPLLAGRDFNERDTSTSPEGRHRQRVLRAQNARCRESHRPDISHGCGTELSG